MQSLVHSLIASGKAIKVPQLCIAVVDDDAGVLSALSDALRFLGYAVHEAASFAEGKALFDGDLRPDLLITDINLGPGPTGIDLIDTARSRLPDLPVLVISGRHGDITFAPAVARSMFLPKPPPFKALRQALADLTQSIIPAPAPAPASRGLAP